jgi:endonuclease/exonuclease/phosphatase family metal-dependent hydrolase
MNKIKIVCWTCFLLFTFPIAVYAETGSAVSDNDNLRTVRLKVMTLNIHSAINWYGNMDLEALVNFIKDSDPDIVGLQEVPLAWSVMTGYQDIPSILAERLQTSYAFSASLERNKGYFGNLILSKYPIIQQWTCLLPGSLEQRSLAFAQILIEGEHINFLTTHLGLSVEDRLQQSTKILDFLNQVSGPLIVTGDFNGGDSDQAVSQLKQNFLDLQSLSEFFNSGTLRSKDGQLNAGSKMDYILATPEFSFVNLQIIDNYISDHVPLVAELTLQLAQ